MAASWQRLHTNNTDPASTTFPCHCTLTTLDGFYSNTTTHTGHATTRADNTFHTLLAHTVLFHHSRRASGHTIHNRCQQHHPTRHQHHSTLLPHAHDLTSWHVASVQPYAGTFSYSPCPHTPPSVLASHTPHTHNTYQRRVDHFNRTSLGPTPQCQPTQGRLEPHRPGQMDNPLFVPRRPYAVPTGRQHQTIGKHADDHRAPDAEILVPARKIDLYLIFDASLDGMIDVHSEARQPTLPSRKLLLQGPPADVPSRHQRPEPDRVAHADPGATPREARLQGGEPPEDLPGPGPALGDLHRREHLLDDPADDLAPEDREAWTAAPAEDHPDVQVTTTDRPRLQCNSGRCHRPGPDALHAADPGEAPPPATTRLLRQLPTHRHPAAHTPLASPR